MNIAKTLRVFFEEKDLPVVNWEIEHNGETHFISNEVVIDTILNATPDNELKEIHRIISMIDFKNGDINHFLEHLAHGLIANRYQ